MEINEPGKTALEPHITQYLINNNIIVIIIS